MHYLVRVARRAGSCSARGVSTTEPLRFRPAIAFGVRLDVEGFADRFTVKPALRKARVVMLADIRHFGLDRSPSPAALNRALTTLHVRTVPKLVSFPLDSRDAEAQRFLAWLANVVPAADTASRPWPEAAQLLGVGKGIGVFASKLFVVGLALVVGAALFGGVALRSVPAGASRAFVAGYRSAPLVLFVAGIIMMVVGWRRHVKHQRRVADEVRASRFD